MKVVDIVAHVLSSPLEEPFAFSQGWVEGRNAMVVEVLTDEGVTGWGESLCHGLQPPEIAASFLEHCFKPMLSAVIPSTSRCSGRRCSTARVRSGAAPPSTPSAGWT